MITESELMAIEECDEYSLRHHLSEIRDLIDSYRQSQEVLARFARWARVVGDCEGVQFSGDHPIALADADHALILAAPKLLAALEAMIGASNVDSPEYLRSCARDAAIVVAEAKGERS